MNLFRIIYILAVAIAVFAFQDFRITLGLLVLQGVLWLAFRIPLRKLQLFRKVMGFSFAILFFYGFFSESRDFALFSFFDYELKISLLGLRNGGIMVAKLFTMLGASFVMRLSTSPGNFAQGLKSIGLSGDTAQILDSILELSMSKRKQKKVEKSGKTGLTLKGVLRGDLSPIIDQLNERLAESRKRFPNSQVATIAALATMVTLIRFIKITPGLPLAPGHKNVLIVPLFILARQMTHKPWAATSIGFISGTANFMAGFGKYGPFGILQFMVPGIVVDLLMIPFGQSRSIWVYGFVGILVGASRVTAELTLAALLDMPIEFYVVYLPFLASQCIFGMLSAPVTKYLAGKIKFENV